jgi:hypothetical protein
MKPRVFTPDLFGWNVRSPQWEGASVTTLGGWLRRCKPKPSDIDAFQSSEFDLAQTSIF